MAGNFKLTIDVEGAERTQIAFTAKAAEIPLRLRKLITSLGLYTQYQAKQYVNKRTALLEQNITLNVEETTGGGTRAVVGVRRQAPYGKYVEEGTGLFHPLSPHWIFPRSGNFMVWIEKGAFATPYQGAHIGHEVIKLSPKGNIFRVFAKKTKGQPGQHYMRRAFEDLAHTYLPVALREFARKT